jgi:hypothetical protein
MMDFRDMLSADLPAPRDDQPGNLRDDILDELADHLACAYRREVIRGVDAETAKHRVLDRFGDPAALACRLWLDAMKGRIMKQRLLVVYSIVLTLVCLGLLGMFWMQSIAAQRLAALAEARATEERYRAEEAQQQVLQQLKAISKAAESPTLPDWIPVTFKLTQDTLDGPPASGFRASLGRGDKGSQRQDAIHRESNDKGEVEFGVVQPGDWEYALSRGVEGDAWHMTGKLNVIPGTGINRTIVCPGTTPKRVRLTVDIDWPTDIADRMLVVWATLGHQGSTYQPPLHWSSTSYLFLLCGSNGRRVEDLKGHRSYFWTSGGEMISSKDGVVLKGATDYVDLIGVDLALEPKDIQAIPGTYTLQQLLVLRAPKERTPKFHGARCELLALSSPHPSGWDFYRPDSPPTDELNPLDTNTPFSPKQFQAGPESFWRNPPSFEARNDQPNHWTIRLPDELIEAVRAKLKGEKKP